MYLYRNVTVTNSDMRCVVVNCCLHVIYDREKLNVVAVRSEKIKNWTSAPVLFQAACLLKCALGLHFQC